MLNKLKNYFSKENKQEKSDSLNGSDSNNMTEEKVLEKEVSIAESPKTETDPAIEGSAPEDEIKKEHSVEEIKEEVTKVLKTCYDPEIPVDVWELGLIYEINVATNGDVLIVMTLTSPSCPVAGILPGEIEQKVKEHPMVNDCKVQLTFDPPWSQQNMSEVAKLELGFL